MKRIHLSIFYLALAAAAWGGQIQTRAELDSILGAEAVTDTFDTFSQPSGSITTFTGNLDSTTVVDGQGPGLVHEGITYWGFQGGNDYFVADGNYGLASQAFQTESRTIHVDFPHLIHAFGVDISGVDAGGEAVSVFIFKSNSLWEQVSLIAYAGQTQFVGWQEEGGIERVQIVNQSGQPYSPLIDNFEFGGSIVPEPASLAVLGIGALLSMRKRRRA